MYDAHTLLTSVLSGGLEVITKAGWARRAGLHDLDNTKISCPTRDWNPDLQSVQSPDSRYPAIMPGDRNSIKALVMTVGLWI